MTIRRMDNVLIVVEDIAAARTFFAELGMELEGETTVEGPWVDQTVGLEGVRADIVMMRTPDGLGRVELSSFHTPPAVRVGPEDAPSNALGMRRIMFAVDDLDDTVARLRRHGAELVGEIAQYEEIYRLCYVRGPEGIIVGLAEQLDQASVDASEATREVEVGSVVHGLIEAIANKDIESFANLYATDAVMFEPLLPEPAHGRDEVARGEAALFAAFSDIEIRVINETASGPAVIAEVVLSATNDGPLDLGAGEIPPTGRPIEVPMVWVLDLNEEGLIVEERDYFDTGLVMQQLGLGE